MERPGAAKLDAEGWRATVATIDQTPTVMYVWAPWSRPSVELLPTIVELEREYPAVPFLFLCLESQDSELARRLEPLGRQFQLAVDYGEAVEGLGIPEPPAVQIYATGGELLQTMTAADAANPLAPADIADALEQTLER